MKNPFELVKLFEEYIIAPKDFQYGMLCIIRDDVPDNVIDAYQSYISLCSKTIQSWDETIIENLEIVGFRECEDKAETEQIEIAKTLIEKWIINKRIL